MVEPGLITAAALDAVRALVAPGVTTLELDAAASAAITARGAVSNFQMVRGYRHTVCASVNDEVVHGIPSDRMLQPGDILSIDCGAEYKGWNGDSAATFVLPDPERPELVAARERLSEVTEGSMWAGIAALATAKHVGDVGTAIEAYLEAQDGQWGILRDYVGHGIGRKMHEAPDVPNHGRRGRGIRLAAGNTLAVEPMLTAGSAEVELLDDGWTVVTVDGSRAAHVEHTVVVTDDGPRILTLPDA